MKPQMKLGAAPFKYLAIAVFATFASVSALANGVEFFNAQTDGPPVLYYFGHVKDASGNVIDKLMITVSAKNVGMNFPFRNDSPGHFRSPDVGRAIQGLGKTVDPSQIEVTGALDNAKKRLGSAQAFGLEVARVGVFELELVEGCLRALCPACGEVHAAFGFFVTGLAGCTFVEDHHDVRSECGLDFHRDFG